MSRLSLHAYLEYRQCQTDSGLVHVAGPLTPREWVIDFLPVVTRTAVALRFAPASTVTRSSSKHEEYWQAAKRMTAMASESPCTKVTSVVGRQGKSTCKMKMTDCWRHLMHRGRSGGYACKVSRGEVCVPSASSARSVR